MKIEQARLSVSCQECPACVHQFNPLPAAAVVAKCGEKEHTQGDCYGLIWFPVRNPDAFFISAMASQQKRAAA